jgi:predicted transposase YdaD
MPATADIGSKRLIELAPHRWVRWLTEDPTAEALDFLSGEFQWVARATDVLIKAHSAHHGTFLLANEIQFRPDAAMSRRIRAYAALAEERYRLPVFPVVLNILPPAANTPIAHSYHSEFMGLIAHQDYKVVNLWDVDVNVVLAHDLVTLLPFAPVLKGGDNPLAIKRALARLRQDADLATMETLLAFFATFVMTPEEVGQLMRWNMTMLRESPWYVEIEKEGLQKGLEQGLQRGRLEGRLEGQIEMLISLLTYRFGETRPELAEQLRRLGPDTVRELLDEALTVSSLPEFEQIVHSLLATTS